MIFKMTKKYICRLCGADGFNENNAEIHLIDDHHISYQGVHELEQHVMTNFIIIQRESNGD